jgi:hypothetical protein
MIFKIKWGDMANLLKKRFKLDTEAKSHIFYFEDVSNIFVFQGKDNIVLSSSIQKENITNLVSFKMEFLSDAIELIEQPNEKISLAI